MNRKNIIALIFLALLTGTAVAEQGYGNIPEDKIYRMKFIISNTAKNLIMTNALEDGCPGITVEIRNMKFNDVHPETSPDATIYDIAGEMDSIHDLVSACYSKKNRKIIKPVKKAEHSRFKCRISETESGEMKLVNGVLSTRPGEEVSFH